MTGVQTCALPIYSGSFFPGIGGILDLLDSLLFNAPIMYLALKYGLAA